MLCLGGFDLYSHWVPLTSSQPSQLSATPGKPAEKTGGSKHAEAEANFKLVCIQCVLFRTSVLGTTPV